MSLLVFDLWDIFIGFAWMLILFAIGFFIKNRNAGQEHYRFYLWNLSFKMLFGGIFAVTFAYVIQGGDTFAYWDGAVKLTNLFWDDPLAYLDEMFSKPSSETIGKNFNSTTGYPPGWIYREPESFYISKILSVINFLTFDSFIAMTFFCSFIASRGSWKFFELIRKYNFAPERWILIASLFIPTVSFWCAGISKDTIILASLFFLLYHIFAFIDPERRLTFRNILFILLHTMILFHTRPFMLIAIAPPLLLGFGAGFIKTISDSPIIMYLTRFVFIGGTLVAVSIYFTSEQGLGELSPDKYLEEVSVIQQDFVNNTTYTGPRYDLGITDFSPAGMIGAAPLAMMTAYFRPFLWEASSAFMLLSALEGTLLMLLLFRFLFLSGSITQQIQFVQKNEILIFAFVFILIFGFFVGFSAGLFNVLIRFKAPLLPFLFLLLAASSKWHKKKLDKEANTPTSAE